MTTTYAYKVRDRAGGVQTGEMEADDQRLVVAKLREMGYVPLSIDAKSGGSGLQKEIKLPGLGGKVKLKDLSVFSRQFATMINSGLSLLKSLSILADQTENDKLREIIGTVAADIESGDSLSGALSRHPKVFSQLYVSMIRAGETGGSLDDVLLQLATTIEKQVELRGKVKSAMTYPVAVLGLVLIIMSAMLIFIVPMFETLYADLGGPLPLPTKMLLAVSGFVTSKLPVIVVAAAAGVYAFRRWVRTATGRAVVDRAKLRVPVFGGLVHKTALARFSRTLESLLRSGVPILESLEITSDTVGNVVMSRAVIEIGEGVRRGDSLAGPMQGMKIFPPMVTQMMAVGEETGALDEMLGKVGAFYEREVEATVDALTSLLEPLLIVVLGGTVGGMVVALYMPMFGIINLIE